jgi:DNA-directed RNA polymerase specialized sigma24 family protein
MAWAGRLLRTNDVDDLVQDTLIVVHAKYRALPVGPAMQDQAGFDRWCRRILYHRIGNDIRRRRLECERRLPAERLLTVATTDTPDRRCEAVERRELLARALKHLNATQRAFLTDAIASSPTAVRRDTNDRDARYARTYRARRALRHALEIEMRA